MLLDMLGHSRPTPALQLPCPSWVPEPGSDSRMLQDLGQLDAIMSFWELSQPLVSRLCEHFNLPCNPPAAVDDARDKQVRWLLLLHI